MLELRRVTFAPFELTQQQAGGTLFSHKYNAPGLLQARGLTEVSSQRGKVYHTPHSDRKSR